MSMVEKKSVTIISSTMVRPIEDTPKGNLWLSRLDMVIRQPYSHTHALYIYSNKTQDTTTNSKLSSKSTYFDADVLRKSLSKVLVPFYPMAGRLTINKNNGRYEIDCNAEGVLFVEAESNHTLIDLEKKLVAKELFYPLCDYSKGLSTFPLVLVQLTRFKCGGVCLGFSQHHHVADGASHVHFNISWSRLARGLEIIVLPIHDRFKYLAPRDPPQVNLLYSDPPSRPKDLATEKTGSVIEGSFKISKSQIDALRQNVMSSQEISAYNVTTFTVLAGHVWRSACKARNLKADQDVKLHIPVDGRQVLKLPLGYCGNVILYAACTDKAGNLMNKPLWYAVIRVCDAIAKMKDSENFRSIIDYMEAQPNLDTLMRGEHNYTCPNLSINSWAKFGCDETDFGWGAPTIIRHGGGGMHEGQSALVPYGSEDGSLLLNIQLFSAHMTLFEKCFYDTS